MRVRYFLAFWLFVLSGVAFLDRTNISIAGLQISTEYGLGNQRLGWIFSAFLIGYAGFQVPAGWLSARFGPRRVLTFGVMSWGIATVFTALLPSTISYAVLFLIGIRFVLGAGESVIYPAANQFVARWVPVKERGFINGLIFAGVGAGSGLTPPLLTWLITHHGWRAAFWFSAIVGFVVGAIWWQRSRDTPEEHPSVTREELAEIHDGLALKEGSSSEGENKISWRAILHRRDLPALMMGYFSFGYIAWIFFSWFFLYMAQVRGFDLKSSARYSMLPFLSMTIFCLLGGMLSDRLTDKFGLRTGRCGLAAVALWLTAVFLVLGSQVHSPQLAGLILAGGAGALYLSQSSFWSVSVDIAGNNSGVFSSMINMGGQIGGAVTASLTPWVAQRYGWTTSFAIAAILAIVGGICWMTVHPERPLLAESSSEEHLLAR
ncbi:MFS transporter [Edaphobacter albus]|uniref:MFS transporter n=1 Tax=Edaphobacter sp. 4G125 TaxID=2763071 RepID=UPI00164868B8|nr:MFS transporter [Edaphobacter sp. 4G125]QNI38569.1 MFS transporter [Edaphobacter sp. 4G125]